MNSRKSDITRILASIRDAASAENREVRHLSRTMGINTDRCLPKRRGGRPLGRKNLTVEERLRRRGWDV